MGGNCSCERVANVQEKVDALETQRRATQFKYRMGDLTNQPWESRIEEEITEQIIKGFFKPSKEENENL